MCQVMLREWIHSHHVDLPSVIPDSLQPCSQERKTRQHAFLTLLSAYRGVPQKMSKSCWKGVKQSHCLQTASCTATRAVSHEK